MNLAFFTKIFSRVQVLLKLLLPKRTCTLGKLVNTQAKGITLLCIEKDNICISCIFNGFKYIYNIFRDLAAPLRLD